MTKNFEAQFVRLQAIRWEDVVEIHTSTSQDEDAALTKELGIGHQHLFKDQRQKPSWKIIVLLHDNGSLTSKSSFRADIAFISHHAIADGISGSAFQKTLLEAFYQASLHSNLQNGWPYLVPPSSPEPLAFEKAFRFAQGISAPSTNTGIVAESPPFDAWTATPPSLPSINDYISRVHLITIPSSQVQNILKACRHLGITLTGLLTVS